MHLWPWISWQQRSQSPGTSAHQASPAQQKTLFHGIMYGPMCSPSPVQVPFASSVGMRRRQSFSPDSLCPQHPRAADGIVHKLSCLPLSKTHPRHRPKPWPERVAQLQSKARAEEHFRDNSGHGSIQEEAMLGLIPSPFFCAVPEEATLH